MYLNNGSIVLCLINKIPFDVVLCQINNVPINYLINNSVFFAKYITHELQQFLKFREFNKILKISFFTKIAKFTKYW